MLANRADIYNLGEVLGDKQAIFALSYLENCLTSNAVLAPLATRDMQDTYALIELAQGRDVNTSDLSHTYSGAELSEIVAVFKRLLVVQDVVLKVNQQYIASAAQSDDYRTEPPFKLQGSYRNMNKMAEKVSAVMNEAELMQMIADHYQGEAQLLTSGAEENLLKLAELRGNMTASEQTRWEAIKQDYQRNRLARKADVEIGLEIVAKLGEMSEFFRRDGETQQELQHHLQSHLKAFNTRLESIQQVLADQRSQEAVAQQLVMVAEHLQQLQGSLEAWQAQGELNEPLLQIANGIQMIGEELSEVSEVSSRKLSWLTGVKKRSQTPSQG